MLPKVLPKMHIYYIIVANLWYWNVLLKHNYESATDSKTNDSAVIIDMSLFTKSHAINENTTFLEFADSLGKTILNESSSCLRYDVIAGQYFRNSLK